jgi:hypothetical protein
MPERKFSKQQIAEFTEIARLAIREYRRRKEEFPLSPGDIVASDGDPRAYKIRKLEEDGTAEIWYPDKETGREIKKILPQEVLYDVNKVQDIAMRIQRERLAKQVIRRIRRSANN